MIGPVLLPWGACDMRTVEDQLACGVGTREDVAKRQARQAHLVDTCVGEHITVQQPMPDMAVT